MLKFSKNLMNKKTIFKTKTANKEGVGDGADPHEGAPRERWVHRVDGRRRRREVARVGVRL